MSRWAMFKDQVVCITGAASGFGRLMTENLQGVGARLVIGDVNTEGLEAVAASLDDPEHVLAMTCDVAVEGDVEALVAAARDRFGRLDIMVNNAGLGSPPKLLTEVTEDELDLNYQVNTKGVFFGIKHGIRQMLAQDSPGGTVLNVASMAGIGAAPLLVAYAAAKHGVVGLTKTAAYEFGRQGIRVNAICPFFSPTPLVTQEGGLGDRMDSLKKSSPMHRMGEPEEMVEVMLMLMSPHNSFMNGQAVAVDGGMSAI